MNAAYRKVIHAARGLAAMRSPSVASILRRQGYKFEAARVQALVDAIDAVPEPGKPARSLDLYIARVKLDAAGDFVRCTQKDPDAVAWSLYRRHDDGTSEHLGDHKTRRAANAALSAAKGGA